MGILKRVNLLLILLWACTGCRPAIRDDLDYSFGVVQTIEHPNLDVPIVQFESVSWDSGDDEQLEQMIIEDGIATGRRVLQLDAETGLISMLCATNGAKSVVASSRHEAAAANSRYNAALLDIESLVTAQEQTFSPDDLFAGLDEKQTFDLILVDMRREETLSAELNSLLKELPKRLAPGGRCLVKCGSQACLSRLQERAAAEQRTTKLLLDDSKKEPFEDNLQVVLVELR